MRMQVDNQIITSEMKEIKEMIFDTVRQRESLKNEMQDWYENNPKEHFSGMKNLMLIDTTLSELDSLYKNLWDYNNKKSS